MYWRRLRVRRDTCIRPPFSYHKFTSFFTTSSSSTVPHISLSGLKFNLKDVTTGYLCYDRMPSWHINDLPAELGRLRFKKLNWKIVFRILSYPQIMILLVLSWLPIFVFTTLSVEGKTSNSVASAWYAGWHSTAGFPLSKVSWSKYTHLTYAFA